MSDQELLDDVDDGESEGEGKKKKLSVGRLGNLLPTLLKFVAIGLGAVILIVTVSAITYSLLSKGGKQQTAIPVTESYLGMKPQYQMFNLLGPVTTRTKDPVPYTVRVDMVIGYDMNDNTSGAEFTARQVQIRDFLRRYFQGKTAEQIKPENEDQVKREIREQINTQILDKARIREIYFNAFEVMETG
ncbi:MAG: flagellar basal body-associated FliL family protein [Spirochaetaceae bacterium]|jgi:flagellar FliL protein|nr:flagellar basal body-associated FliL family protein [Spirochaetaceae bacterium]